VFRCNRCDIDYGVRRRRRVRVIASSLDIKGEVFDQPEAEVVEADAEARGDRAKRRGAVVDLKLNR